MSFVADWLISLNAAAAGVSMPAADDPNGGTQARTELGLTLGVVYHNDARFFMSKEKIPRSAQR
jgi:hypothetical protein